MAWERGWGGSCAFGRPFQASSLRFLLSNAGWQGSRMKAKSALCTYHKPLYSFCEYVPNSCCPDALLPVLVFFPLAAKQMENKSNSFPVSECYVLKHRPFLLCWTTAKFTASLQLKMYPEGDFYFFTWSKGHTLNQSDIIQTQKDLFPISLESQELVCSRLSNAGHKVGSLYQHRTLEMDWCETQKLVVKDFYPEISHVFRFPLQNVSHALQKLSRS